jgi:hypothetical protein
MTIPSVATIRHSFNNPQPPLEFGEDDAEVFKNTLPHRRDVEFFNSFEQGFRRRRDGVVVGLKLYELNNYKSTQFHKKSHSIIVRSRKLTQ